MTTKQTGLFQQPVKRMEHRVFIAIGSNLGDRAAQVRRAVELICKKARLIKKSSLYETEPWGLKDQGLFLNAVIEVETGLGPLDLLGFLKGIEKELGRTEAVRWGPRTIDLDILFYDGEVFERGGLVIPHPGLHERAFVLVPLNEIAPGFIHPVLKKTVSELLKALGSASPVRIYET